MDKNERVKKNEWFEDWFNSEYYHLLYQNRSQNEADLFIKNIVQKLKLDPEATVLDLGCGKGRHALKMSSFFNSVHGLDLSKNNIKIANSTKKDNMKFFIGDMRNFNHTTRYDYVFNLFTSFGYFNTIEENLDVLKCVHQQLKKNGHLLVDFLNPDIIRNDKFSSEEKRINDVHFKIIFDKQLEFNNEQSIENITERLNRWLEEKIMKNPEQWIWTHNRWKR